MGPHHQPDDQPEEEPRDENEGPMSLEDYLESGRNASQQTKEFAQRLAADLREDPFMQAMIRHGLRTEGNVPQAEDEDSALVQKVIQGRSGDTISPEDLEHLDNCSASYETAAVEEYVRLRLADPDGFQEERLVLLQMLLHNGTAGMHSVMHSLLQFEKPGNRCYERIEAVLEQILREEDGV